MTGIEETNAWLKTFIQGINRRFAKAPQPLKITTVQSMHHSLNRMTVRQKPPGQAAA